MSIITKRDIRKLSVFEAWKLFQKRKDYYEKATLSELVAWVKLKKYFWMMCETDGYIWFLLEVMEGLP